MKNKALLYTTITGFIFTIIVPILQYQIDKEQMKLSSSNNCLLELKIDTFFEDSYLYYKTPLIILKNQINADNKIDILYKGLENMLKYKHIDLICDYANAYGGNEILNRTNFINNLLKMPYSRAAGLNPKNLIKDIEYRDRLEKWIMIYELLRNIAYGAGIFFFLLSFFGKIKIPKIRNKKLRSRV